MFGSTQPVRIIGTRHGEKLYETLVNREEMSKAKDLGEYFRVPADNRDLNYDKFFLVGAEKITAAEEYHSHNTIRLDKSGMMKLLMKLNLNSENINRS